MKVKITGTGSCLPKLRVTNDDLGQIMETSDEWIRSRTGIIARHIAVEETTTGMSTEAAGKALKNAEISAEDVDIIIAATVSADKHLPGLACEVQKKYRCRRMQLRSTSMQRVPVFFSHWILRRCI